MTKFVPSIYSAYLTEIENIFEPEDISIARKIEWYMSWKENVVKMAILKIVDDENPFHVQWYGGKNKTICGYVDTSESDDECAKCHGSYIEGEEWLCCPVSHQWYQEDFFYE